MMTSYLYVVTLMILGVGKCQSDMGDLFLETVSATQKIEPVSMGLYDLNGKKWEGTYYDTARGLYKRGLSGFMGVRGKKADETFLGYEKKNILSGFMGVRGMKKTYFPFYMSYKSDKGMPPVFAVMRENNDVLDGQEHPLGFYELRGKQSQFAKGSAGHF